MDKLPQFGPLESRKVPHACMECLQGWKSSAHLAPASCVVRGELEHGRSRPCCQDFVQPPPGLDLPPSWSFADAEEVGAGEAHLWGDKPLVSGDQSGSDVGWDQGRLGSGGQPVAGKWRMETRWSSCSDLILRAT